MSTFNMEYGGREVQCSPDLMFTCCLSLPLVCTVVCPVVVSEFPTAPTTTDYK